MNLADFFSQGLALVGTFNLKIAAFLFLLCFIGEATVFIVPYLFETTWLMVGYQLSKGILSPFDLTLLLLTSVTKASDTLVTRTRHCVEVATVLGIDPQ